VVTTAGLTESAVREVLAQVHDPEIPVITIEDLGILRDVAVVDGRIVVTITPTYSGCPAMDEIRADISAALAARGWGDVEVRTVLAPAWTTDWMSEEGKSKLREFGIAPPSAVPAGPVLVQLRSRVECPQCGSTDTEETARFASTSCKALWRCRTCREPFDHLRAH
jgi:ring-1,2-phenylacetyl-CoA epoxidase subunit PaaD